MVQQRPIHLRLYRHRLHRHGRAQLHKPRRAFGMVTDSNGTWLTPSEAADILGLSRSRIYHLRDKLTHRKGTRLFFLRESLFDDYMNI